MPYVRLIYVLCLRRSYLLTIATSLWCESLGLIESLCVTYELLRGWTYELFLEGGVTGTCDEDFFSFTDNVVPSCIVSISFASELAGFSVSGTPPVSDFSCFCCSSLLVSESLVSKLLLAADAVIELVSETSIRDSAETFFLASTLYCGSTLRRWST